MESVYLTKTKDPARLHSTNGNTFYLYRNNLKLLPGGHCKNYNIYVTDVFGKVILTDDKKAITDGVQEILEDSLYSHYLKMAKKELKNHN